MSENDMVAIRGELVTELRTLFGLWVERVWQAKESECLVS